MVRLGHPCAALLGFVVSVLAYNVLTLIQRAPSRRTSAGTIMTIQLRTDGGLAEGRSVRMLPSASTIACPGPIARTTKSVTRAQRWPGKFGQADKWNFCLRAARVPPIRSDNGK